jgi:alginate O-acetyltransferase complex protein AlgI
MKPAGLVLTLLSVTSAMIFFRSPTMTSAIDLVKGLVGLNGIGLPQKLLEHLGSLGERLHAAGVAAESWSLQDFVKTVIWISVLMFIALACPNTLQILARYEPALGVTAQSAKLPIGSMIEWDASLPWAIVVSAVAAIAIVSMGGPSEFLYWQF